MINQDPQNDFKHPRQSHPNSPQRQKESGSEDPSLSINSLDVVKFDIESSNNSRDLDFSSLNGRSPLSLLQQSPHNDPSVDISPQQQEESEIQIKKTPMEN